MKRYNVFGIAAAGFLAGSALVFGPVALGQGSGAPAGGSPAKSESVSMRARWSKGDVARFDVTMESRRKSGIEGRDESVQTQRLLQDIRVTRRVLDANDKGATLSIAYERVQMNIFAEKSIMKFDSASPAAEDEGNELAPTARAVVGRPFTIKVDPTGAVLSIEGNEEPTAKTDEDLQRATMARSLIGDEIFERVLRPLYGLTGAPERAATGDSWTSEEINDRPPIGVLTLDARHTVGAITEGVASVSTTGTVRLTRAVGNMAIKADLSSYEIKGQADWDSKAGSIRTYESEQRVLIAAEDASGNKRSLDSTARITIKRVADDKPKAEPARP